MSVHYLERPGAERMAYRRIAGRAPGILWLSGFKSDMTGLKATRLADWAERTGQGFLAFDYFGHGASSGNFGQGTIGRWLSDATAALDELAKGPQILVGSSMGGWIALLLAIARPERIKSLLLIAPAPDFTQDLIWAKATSEMREAWENQGVWLRPSAYGEPQPITWRLIEEARAHLILGRPIAVSCPVHIVHGRLDADIPYERSLRLAGQLASPSVLLEPIASGDHRLSDAETLGRIEEIVAGLAGQ